MDLLETDPRWDEKEVVRVLEWFEKEGVGYFVGMESLTGLALHELRTMFDVSADDVEDPPMFFGYEVRGEHVPRLQRAVSHQIDLDAFDYSVAAYQRDT